jgi:SAM-dependent methyltransferase
VCQSADGLPYTRVLGYAFRRCRECALVYMTPRPSREALLSLYDERYFESPDPNCGYAVYAADRDSIRDKSFRLLRMLERHGKPGRLLDVGCAYGFLLEVARERGWEVAGIEPAAAVAARVAAQLGVAVHPDLLGAAFPPASFDAVTLWDVIEHMPDPREALSEVHRIIKPTGVCSIVTPDIGSLAARLLGNRWEEVQKMPEHIFLFSRASLSALFRSTGFSVLEWGTVGKRMKLEEVMTRLTPTAPSVWRRVHALARAIGAHRLEGYFDPRWKLSVVVRPEPRA